MVTSFKYLGRVLLVAHDNWTAVVNNLQREQQNWARMIRVLSRESADARTLRHIYLALIQTVIIYGLETWFMTLRIGRVLGGLHHRVARRLMGRQHQR